jgi:hypothetical protein
MPNAPDHEPDPLADRCVACQQSSEDWVRYGQVALPVCLTCWNKLDTATRIRLAIQLEDRHGGWRDAVRTLCEKLGISLDRAMDGDNPLDLFSSRN